MDSPLNIEMELGLSGNEITVSANIEVTGDVSSYTSPKVVFLLSHFLPNSSSDYVNRVVAYQNPTAFSLTEIGESVVEEQSFVMDESWDLSEINAVCLVQSWTDTKHILQAQTTGFTGVIPLMDANVTTGPSNLSVQFVSNSFPQGGVDSWEWDFDEDGIVDSNSENPFYIYDTPGTYDVTLRISSNGEIAETTSTGYITVTDGSDVSGDLSGIWNTSIDTYTITDDVTIREGAQLLIQPGVKLKIENGAKFNVYGTLEILGSETDRVVMESDSSWEGISLLNNQNNNKIEYCNLSGATVSGVYVSSSKVDIKNCKIHDNSSSSFAAAIEVCNSNDVTIANNIITNNVSSANSGAIGCISSSIDVRNNIIVNNDGALGGAFVLKNQSDISIVNNTIANNQANNVFFVFNSNPEIRNSIIAESINIFQNLNGNISIAYTDITGGYEGTGNIDTDPMFIAATTGNGSGFDGLVADWSLAAGSPCIDAGDPAAEYNDADGSVNDMGAFGGLNGFVVDNEDEQVQSVISSTIGVYPNPFNPTTTISLNLKDADLNKPVSMAIFNVKGQLVKTLLNNEVPAKNSYAWNGRDNSGSATASGIYFVQLKTASELATSKMILMK